MKLADGISKDEKKLVRKMFWRSMTMYASVNPVTMGGGGFAYSMMPFINHFYKSEEDRAAALERHTQYFSTTIPCASFVMGMRHRWRRKILKKLVLTWKVSTRSKRV